MKPSKSYQSWLLILSCSVLVDSFLCIRLKTEKSTNRPSEQPSLTCCDHPACYRSCTLTAKNPQCARTVSQPGIHYIKDGSVKRKSEFPELGCGNRSIPTVSYVVDGEGEVREGQGTCTSTHCNKCRFPFELCPFPGKKDPRELKCACNKNFINNTYMSYKDWGSKWGIIRMDQFCINDQCDFQHIQRKLEFPQSMQDLFICVTEVTEKEGSRIFRYGCDLAQPSGRNAYGKSREVWMSSDKTNWRVECRDFDQCNHLSLYQRSPSSWNADPAKLQSCIFNDHSKKASTKELCEIQTTRSSKSSRSVETAGFLGHLLVFSMIYLFRSEATPLS